MRINLKSRVDNAADSVQETLDKAGRMVAIGGVAFGLVSIVAVVALMIATAALISAKEGA